ncbi:MAG TPA: tyrosine-type recombinase/integrase, partial [Chitinophagaceae bacterium]|nr:tyrosine-type recombinase/integrase [Chitinophagaceae bacterium]
YLNGEEVVDEARINIHVTVVNKYLKELAKYCGIFKKLSTHVARHTWTDMALKATDGNIYEVQKSLGHTSVKTTETYSRKLTNYSRTSVVKDVLANIKKNQPS